MTLRRRGVGLVFSCGRQGKAWWSQDASLISRPQCRRQTNVAAQNILLKPERNRMFLWIQSFMHKKRGYFILGSACGSGAATAWFLWSRILADQKKEEILLEKGGEPSESQETVQKEIENALVAQSIQELQLVEMTDDLYETTDHLCVFCVEALQDLRTYQSSIHRFKCMLEEIEFPFSIHYCYSLLPRVDEKNDSTGPVVTRERGHTTASLPVRVVLHKGLRKLTLDLPKEEPLTSRSDDRLTGAASSEARSFFRPVSQEEEEEEEDSHNEASQEQSETETSCFIQTVTYNTFSENVLQASSSETPILVQMMETSCFLCFLMRPFINTVASILKNDRCSLQMKRLNLDKNDFPVGCPVVRSTPCFVEYRGQIGTSTFSKTVWKEYKPQDLVQRLIQSYSLSDSSVGLLNGAVEQLQLRFEKFALLALWTQELKDLQKFYADPSSLDQYTEEMYESEYLKIVKTLVAEDQRRSDGLQENLKYLDEAIASVQSDCLVFLKMINPDALQELLCKVPSRFHLVKQSSLLSQVPKKP